MGMGQRTLTLGLEPSVEGRIGDPGGGKPLPGAAIGETQATAPAGERIPQRLRWNRASCSGQVEALERPCGRRALLHWFCGLGRPTHVTSMTTGCDSPEKQKFGAHDAEQRESHLSGVLRLTVAGRPEKNNLGLVRLGWKATLNWGRR